MGSLGKHLLIHQPSYSMLRRDIEQPMGDTGSLKDVLRREGVGCIAFAPLRNGILTDRYINGIPSDSRAAHAPRYLR